MRLPNHIGIIPDGNRRWAESKGMSKEKGYGLGINPGLTLFKLCQQAKIKEITYYGFTVDNTKRPTEQRMAYTDACIQAVKILSQENADLLVIGIVIHQCFQKNYCRLLPEEALAKGE